MVISERDSAVPVGGVLAPCGSDDLRDRAVRELCYPPVAIVLVAGIPGAGKTTLLHRLFATTGRETSPVRTGAGVVVLDSEQCRNWWRRWLRWLPYRVWRPLVHLTHYLRVRAALRTDAAIVVHDCGTRRWIPRLLHRRVQRGGTALHVLLLDTPPAVALAGQHRRGRPVNARAFATHCRRWRQQTATDSSGLLAGSGSAVLLDRASASRLRAIRFTAGPLGHPGVPGRDRHHDADDGAWPAR